MVESTTDSDSLLLHEVRKLKGTLKEYESKEAEVVINNEICCFVSIDYVVVSARWSRVHN